MPDSAERGEEVGRFVRKDIFSGKRNLRTARFSENEKKKKKMVIIWHEKLADGN